MHFQDLIAALNNYWNRRGCLLAQPYDMEKGAATFNPSTFLRSLGPEPYDAAWAEPCRRPKDGRYGENPNRMQHYFQYQVVLKPSPLDILDQYIGSLVEIGIKPSEHDIRFVHDDWESPTLGAWGLGWEVWLDGMEITQFTYFQQVGGIDLSPVMGEITYGLERICMYLQKVDNVFKLKYNDRVTYGDIYHNNEVQFSKHNFELSDAALHARLFDSFESECRRLCVAGVPAPAFDYCMKASHSFNLLDARGAISVNERQGYILRVRNLAKAVAEAWLKSREAQGYPLLRTARPAVSAASAGAASAAVPAGAISLMGAAAAAHAPVPSADGRAPLLVELGVEEMPARVFGPLMRDLPALLKKHLEPTLLDARDIKVFATPRRIAISAGSILTRQPDQDLELKGPPASLARDAQGNWTKAAEAFARKNGLDLAKLEIKALQGGEYLYARSQRMGREAAEILAEVMPRVFAEIHWYKTMRWGDGNVVPFVRPVLWLAALLGDRVVPMAFGGVTSGAHSRGHRFLHNREVAVVADRKGYLDALRAAKVIADPAERKDRIRRAAEEAAAGAGLRWRKDEDLLETVTYLVEWPVPVVGGFDARLLEVPEEVLVSEMKEHQKYFALEKADGKLANAFIATANMECADYALVREGNEKVLRARFADAEFFLREDRQRPLESRGKDLGKIAFLADLGPEASLAAKVERVRALAAHIAGLKGLTPGRPAPDLEAVDAIARLAKCDLTTNMVGEFPELQGIMGRYYAIAEGLPAKVADGIRDQYMPRNAEDGFPGSDEAAIAGLADRLDSLVVMFAKGKAPTGSADPFALRRACWTAVALIVNRGFRLDIGRLVAHAVQSARGFLKPAEAEGLADKLLEFFLARAKRLFQEESRPGLPGGFPADTVDAVVQSKAGWRDFTDMADRLKALQAFRGEAAFGQAAETFKRVSNILPGALSGELDAGALGVDAEQKLLRAVLKTEQEVRAGMSSRSYGQVLGAVSALRGDVASLFDAVMVNDPDPRLKQNRHLLLGKVRDLVGEIADFSAIQG